MKKMSWTDCVRNEVLQTVKEERYCISYKPQNEDRLTGLATSFIGTAV
jgi:hypothetical protein